VIRWLLLCALLTAPARAAELTVMSAGAINSVANAIVPSYEAESGNTVVLRNDTVGGLVRRINGGETFDVVLMSPAGLAELQKVDKIAATSMTDLAKVGVGVAVKAGAPMPDISTADSFRAALLAARAVAYVDPASGATSGKYLATLFQTMGIADAMAAKSVLVQGGLAAETLRDGRADMALQQISELMGVHGVVVVGPLPAEIQSYTVYSGAVAAQTAHPDAARAFLADMKGDTAKAMMAARRMTAP
jgi:molybdate transport system substrate-binding protein